MASNFAALAGNFLEAFTRSKEAAKDREQNDKYKKVMTQLMELQIDQAQRSRSAQTKVGEMMAPQQVQGAPVPQFQFPEEGQLGEIETTGSRPGPSFNKPGMSFMEMMTDPDGRMAALESGMTKQLEQ